MLDELLTAAGLADAGSIVIARVSALDGAPLVPWQPCLLLLDAPHGLNRAALRRYPPATPVTLISETADGLQTRQAPVDQLDDQRTDAVAIALPAVPMHDVRNHSEGLRGVIDRLRDPVDGCPWDNAQTHASLRPHLLEETYEALEALDSGDPEALCEELGDVLMQVVLHAKLAEQDGAFDLDDVSEGIRAKLVRRHPHVFADAHVDSAAATEQMWERLKAHERPTRESVLDGVPKTLPALARAQSILGRADRNGLPRRHSGAAGDASIGDQILDLVLAARSADLSAEDEARDALAHFESRVRRLESQLRSEDLSLTDLNPEALTQRWSASA